MAIWNINERINELREELMEKIEGLAETERLHWNGVLSNSRNLMKLNDALKKLRKRVVLLEEEKSGLNKRLFGLVEESTKDVIK